MRNTKGKCFVEVGGDSTKGTMVYVRERNKNVKFALLP